MKTYIEKKLVIFFSLLLVLGSTVPTLAAGPIYGPVNTLVNSTYYNVYYTNVPYYQVIENYGTVPDPTIKADTAAPNTLTGIAAASPLFLQPWWDPSSTNNPTSAAALAAQTWYNSSGPWGQGVKFPNTIPLTPPNVSTPYFVYATNDAATVAYYATVDSPSGTLRFDQVSVDQTGVSFALAGVSN